MPDEKEKGIECTVCGCRHFSVIYTRPQPSGSIVRRRECRNCGKRVTTVERPIGSVDQRKEKGKAGRKSARPPGME